MNLLRAALLSLMLLICQQLLPCSRADNWPRFRGPNGTGISQDKDIPIEWKDDNILWKCSLPGVGHSSPIVWGERIFLQTASADGKERRMLCVNTADGTIAWSTPVRGKKGVTHLKNSLASGTPATDGKQVYALFWDGKDLEAVAFDFSGKLVWQKDLGGFTSQHGAGHSPIVHDGKVFFANDQDGSAKIIALETATGTEVWSRERKAFRACYSTPFLLDRAEGTKELIVTSSAGVTSYNPRDGHVNWDYTWTFDDKPLRTVASSIYSQGLIFSCSGAGEGGRHAIVLKAHGKGDVTRTALVWENKKDLPYVPSLLASGDHIFTVTDDGIAGCYVARTGHAVWKARLQGGDVSASPVMIDGKIYVVNEKGDVFVYEADTKFKLLASNSLNEAVTATPAVANGRLYIRGKEHLYCIGKKK